MIIYRQGDVLLKSCESIPKQARKKSKVLAYGEVTGHAHQFLDEQVIVYEYQNQQFVEALQDVDLFHEEHDIISIKKGLYEVIRQREVDLLGEVRQVSD